MDPRGQVVGSIMGVSRKGIVRSKTEKKGGENNKQNLTGCGSEYNSVTLVQSANL